MIPVVVAQFAAKYGKYIAYFFIALVVVCSLAYAIHRHTVAELAKQELAVEKANEQALSDNAKRNELAVRNELAQAKERADKYEAIAKAVQDAADAGTDCSSSPAVRQLLDGLQSGTGGDQAAPAP